ncbi:MAG TPA: hypothetical protein VIN05_15740 [Roseovarius sp.]
MLRPGLEHRRAAPLSRLAPGIALHGMIRPPAPMMRAQVTVTQLCMATLVHWVGQLRWQVRWRQ